MWWCVRSGARWYSVSKKVSEVGKAGGNVGESDRWVLGKYVSELESKQASKQASEQVGKQATCTLATHLPGSAAS